MVKELTYVFHPGRSLVFYAERPASPSAAFVQVDDDSDGDVQFHFSDDGSTWTEGATVAVQARSVNKMDLPTGGKYIQVRTTVKIVFTAVHISTMDFVELGHEAVV